MPEPGYRICAGAVQRRMDDLAGLPVVPDESFAVIGYDPGLASGIAAVSFAPDSTASVLFTGEEPWLASITTVMALLDVYPDAHVAIEKFTITMATAKKSQQPYSLWCIGAVGWSLGVAEREFHLQTPADAKRFVSNQQLKSLGLWHRGGAGHAIDALRHTVLCAARNRWVPDYSTVTQH